MLVISKEFLKLKFAWDVLTAFQIIFVPMLLYTHLLFSNSSDHINILGFFYEHQYRSTRNFMWALLIRFIPLYLLIIWFLNCFYWWRYFILVPALFFGHLVFKTFIYNQFVEIHLVAFSLSLNTLALIILTIFDNLILVKIRNHDFCTSRRNIFLIGSGNSFNLKHIKKWTFKKRGKNSNNVYSNFESLVFIEKSLSKMAQSFSPIQIERNKRGSDVLIILTLILVPFLGNVHELFESGVKNLDFGYASLDSMGWPDIRTFIYYLCIKVSIVIPLFIWFVSCRAWWRHAILIPIILTAYQMAEVLRNTNGQADEIELFQLLPIIIGVLLALFLLSKTVDYQIGIIQVHKKVSEEMEKKLGELSDSTFLSNKKLRYENLKRDMERSLKIEDELAMMMSLREEILAELNNNKNTNHF